MIVSSQFALLFGHPTLIFGTVDLDMHSHARMDPMDCAPMTVVSRLLDLPDELKLEVIQHVS